MRRAASSHATFYRSLSGRPVCPAPARLVKQFTSTFTPTACALTRGCIRSRRPGRRGRGAASRPCPRRIGGTRPRCGGGSRDAVSAPCPSQDAHDDSGSRTRRSPAGLRPEARGTACTGRPPAASPAPAPHSAPAAQGTSGRTTGQARRTPNTTPDRIRASPEASASTPRVSEASRITHQAAAPFSTCPRSPCMTTKPLIRAPRPSDIGWQIG